MNRSPRQPYPYGNHRTELQHGNGGAGQPDYSFGGSDQYSSSYGDDDDGWRENFAQRDIDDYRHGNRGDYDGRRSHDRGQVHPRGDDYVARGDEYADRESRYGSNRYSPPDQNRSSMSWRDAPEEWDRYAREQRGSAYDFYSGRRGMQGYRRPSSQGQRRSQGQSDLANFPDFNPPDEHYVYPGASRAWESRSQQWQPQNTYRGYPYTQQDFERSWQHHPSHTQNEYAANQNESYGPYAQNREQSGARGAFGLGDEFSDNRRHYSSSAAGNRSAGHQYRGGFSGRGPKGYERSDERIREDICERLEQNPYIDASEISVSVKSGVVTLEGQVDQRMQKHHAEDIADSCAGVKDVQNRINVSRRDMWDLSESRNSDQSARTQPQVGAKDVAKDLTSDDKDIASNTQKNITRQ